MLVTASVLILTLDSFFHHQLSSISDSTSHFYPTQHEYKFDVAMTCGGCSGAVTRVLGKLEGK